MQVNEQKINRKRGTGEDTLFPEIMGLSEINSKNYDIILDKVKSTPVTPVTSSSMSEYSDSTYNIKTEINQQQKHLSNKEISEIVIKYNSGVSTYELAKCRIVLMRLMRSSWLLNTKTVLNGVTVANYSMHNIVREAVRSQADISKEEHCDLIWKAWVKLLLDVRIKKETDIKWGTKVHAEPGECVRFRIGVQNMSSEMFRNLVLRDLLPDGLSYVEGSTMIFNTAHPKGVTLSDKIIHDNGINIGDYAPGANAWIYFNAVTSEEPRDRNMIYRNVIQATVGPGTSKETFVDVLVETSETL